MTGGFIRCPIISALHGWRLPTAEDLKIINWGQIPFGINGLATPSACYRFPDKQGDGDTASPNGAVVDHFF